MKRSFPASPGKRAVGALLLLAAAAAGQEAVDSIVYDSRVELKTYTSDGPVRAFAVRRTTLWLGTDGGVISADIRTGVKKSRFSALETIEAPRVNAMAVDCTGAVWVGTDNGCASLKKGSWRVAAAADGPADSRILSLCVDRTGNVWAGTGAGLSVRMGGAWKSPSGENAPGKGAVEAVIRGKGADVWCGAASGIYRYDGRSWSRWTMRQGLPWNDAHALAYDPRNGHVWAAVGERDVCRFDGTEWNVFMDIAPGIRALMVDTQCRVWCGSPTGGLIKFNGMEWVNDPARLGITAREVRDLYRDGGGNLWFATGRGVVRMKNPYPF